MITNRLLDVARTRQRRPQTAADAGELSAKLSRQVARQGATHWGESLARRSLKDVWLLVQSLFRGYAELTFLQGARIGMVMFVISWLNPRSALLGCLAVVVAFEFARVVGLGARFHESGFYTFNPLLVGLGIGSLFSLSWPTVLLTVGASVFTMVVSIGTSTFLQRNLALPVLSVPFACTISLVYLASLRYPGLVSPSPGVFAAATRDFGLPLASAAFLRSLGAIVFLPYVAVGLLFAALLAWRSRILFALALWGFFLGTSLQSAMLGRAAAYSDVINFNFSLIAMAVGGVFLIPSPRSYFIASLAVCATPVVIDAAQIVAGPNRLPVYTLPFILITLLFLYTLGSVSYPGIRSQLGVTPEDTLDLEFNRRNRFAGEARTLRLPFFGNWTVWQAFDDVWTHQGAWKYAYDFVITDEGGATHLGTGEKLEDFHCYRKPVLAPCRGRIARVINDLPDNPIGTINREQTWGNQVVIYDERGFHVQLSHFSPGSICVHEGEHVVAGTMLGRCGNSGYSPQPHIHIQVQQGLEPSSGTLPFSFAAYVCDGLYHANRLPPKNATLHTARPNPQLNALTDFILNEKYEYALSFRGRLVQNTKLEVKMASDGTFFFDAEGRARLYFGKHEGTFYFYRLEKEDPVLRLLFLALPRLPLAHAVGVSWQDVLPVTVAARGIRRALARSASSMWPGLARIDVGMRFHRRELIETEVSSNVLSLRQRFQVEFGQTKGIAAVSGEGWSMQRIAYETL